MRMRARSFDRRPSYWFICGLLARKMWMKEGGGGENGSALLFGASLALRLWLARRRENKGEIFHLSPRRFYNVKFNMLF